MIKIKTICCLAIALSLMAVLVKQDRTANKTDISESADPQGYIDYFKMRRGNFRPSEAKKAFDDAKDFYRKQKANNQKDAGLKQWTWKGPGNIGGRVRALAIRDNGSGVDEIFAGSSGGGMLHSTDAGNTWSYVSDFLPSLIITSIAIDPTNTDRMFASTGDGFGGSGSIPGAGILFSVDGGNNWGTLPGTSEWYYINKVIIDPHDPATLYAVRTNEDDDLNRVNFGSIERSTTGGLTWENGWFTVNPALDIEVDPWDPENVLVGTSNDVYKSTVSNGNWSFNLVAGMTGNKRMEIAFAPSAVDVVYALAEVNNGSFYRSLDGGSTWTLRSDTTDMGPIMWHYNSLFVDPNLSSRVIAGGIDIYRTTDAGLSFTKISNWETFHEGMGAHADNHIFVPSVNYSMSSPVVYVGNDGGVQRMDSIWTERNRGWHNLANTTFGVTQFYGADAKKDGSLFIGGTQDNSFCFGSNDGDWIVTTSGDGSQAEINYLDEDIMYANLKNNKIRKTTDGGATWELIASFETSIFCSNSENENNSCCQANGPGIDGTPCIDEEGIIRIDDNSPLIGEFIMDPDDPTILYVGATSLWRIDDAPAGRSVQLLTSPGGLFVTTIAVANNGQIIWVGNTGTTLRATFDGGNNWDDFDDVLPLEIDYPYTDIAIDPLNINRILVSKGGYRQDNLFLIDVVNGSPSESSATDISLPFPMQVNTVAFHPTRSGWLYIGTDVGVFASEDFGQTWSITPIFNDIQGAHPNEGPVYSVVEELFWYGDGSVDYPFHLGAATFGRGIWVTTQPVFSHVYVDKNYAGVETGSFSQPFNTFEEALDFAAHGVTIVFKSSGDHEESGTPLLLNKRIKVEATGGSAVIK